MATKLTVELLEKEDEGQADHGSRSLPAAICVQQLVLPGISERSTIVAIDCRGRLLLCGLDTGPVHYFRLDDTKGEIPSSHGVGVSHAGILFPPESRLPVSAIAISPNRRMVAVAWEPLQKRASKVSAPVTVFDLQKQTTKLKVSVHEVSPTPCWNEEPS